VGLIIVTVLTLVVSFLKAKYATLDWQQGSFNMNPINDFSLMQKVVLTTTTAMIYVGNLQKYRTYKNVLNLTTIDSLQPTLSYEKQAGIILDQTKARLKANLWENLGGSSPLVTKFISDAYDTKISVSNVVGRTILNPAFLKSSIPLTYLEYVLINYVDMDLIKKNKPIITDKILNSAIGAVNGARTVAMRG
jgi:hypothetical protein